jgi:hypothetical protein
MADRAVDSADTETAAISAPLFASQMRAEPSSEADAILLASGEKTAELTAA